MLGPLIRPDVQELIRDKRWAVLRDALSEFDPSDIAEIVMAVPDEDDVAIFRLLPRDLASSATWPAFTAVRSLATKSGIVSVACG
jgi:magnesium transporter